MPLEEADCEDDPDLRKKLLTFVVGGGGFSGVEAMAELNDFIREVKGNYAGLRNEEVRCVLVQSGERTSCPKWPSRSRCSRRNYCASAASKSS